MWAADTSESEDELDLIEGLEAAFEAAHAEDSGRSAVSSTLHDVFSAYSSGGGSGNGNMLHLSLVEGAQPEEPAAADGPNTPPTPSWVDPSATPNLASALEKLQRRGYSSPASYSPQPLAL